MILYFVLFNSRNNDLGRACAGFGLIFSGHSGDGGGGLRPEAGSGLPSLSF